MNQIYTVSYLNAQAEPKAIRIIADSETHAVSIVSRWETSYTDIQATACQEVNHAK